MRLVFFADLHLDAPFIWARPDPARRRRQALRDTLVRILALAAEVRAEAVLCAGDLFEHDRVTPDTGAFLREALGGVGCPVLIAPGNHDWYGRQSLYADGRWPSGVTVFREESLTPFSLSDGLTIWGAAFGGPTRQRGFLDAGFAVDRGGVNLALFHGTERASLPFDDSGKAAHGPFDAGQVEAAGLGHAFVGHIHGPRDEAWFTYPGNPDPLTFGERGLRGAVVVEIGADGSIRRERHQVAVSQVHDLMLDVSGAASLQDIRERVAGALAGLGGVGRVTVHGDLDPDVNLDLRALEEVQSDLEQLVVRASDLTTTYDFKTLGLEPTVRGRFVRDVEGAPALDEVRRRRVLVTGLRALDGRSDLEVP